MRNSSRYFKNTDCEYYPCHFAGQNCLFCYCPLFNHDCRGQYDKMLFMKRGIKDCSKCSLPHIDMNYDTVISKLCGETDAVWRRDFVPAKSRKKRRT